MSVSRSPSIRVAPWTLRCVFVILACGPALGAHAACNAISLAAGIDVNNDDPSACLIGAQDLATGRQLYNSTAGFLTVGDSEAPSAADVFTVHGLFWNQGGFVNFGTVSNVGQVLVNSSDADTVGNAFANRGTFNNDAAFDGYQGTFSNYGTVNNTGYIDLRADSPFINHGSGTFINSGDLNLRGPAYFGGTFVNNGRIGIQQSITIGNFDHNLSTGPLEFISGASSVVLVGPQAILTVRGDNGAALGFNALVLQGGVAVQASSSANYVDISISERDAFTTLDVQGNADFRVDVLVGYKRTSAGTIDTTAPGLKITNAGFLQISNGDMYGGSIVNTGQLSILGRLGGNSTFTQSAGLTTLGSPFDPSNSGDLTISNTDFLLGGQLCGNGTVHVAGMSVGAGGSLCPGFSPGHLTIDGNLRFTGGAIDIQIGGSGAGAFDVLTVTGLTSFLDGTLRLSFIDGFVPGDGESWAFLEALGGLIGLDHLAILFDGLPEGYTVSTWLNGDLLEVSVASALTTPVPEPETWALVLAGLGALSLSRRRRVIH